MAKLNPGFDVHGDHKISPPLTKDPHVKLTDYIVKERLFNFWFATLRGSNQPSRSQLALRRGAAIIRARHPLSDARCPFRLEQGCIPLTKEHALMAKMVVDNPWPRPIVVYGYDDTLALAGDLFEAETDCVSQHNLGQVASLVNNLAFWSRKPPITQRQSQVPEPPAAPYNKSKTYVSIVIGDGDNIGFVKG